jgi:HK97 family phage portal protein
MLTQVVRRALQMRSGSLENPGNPLNAYSLAAALQSGSESTAGVPVTLDGALSLPIVWTCVSLLARTVASLPLVVYRRTSIGKERAIDHPLYGVLHDLPNAEMTAFDLHAALMAHLALHGNAFCEIVRDGNGAVKELWPLPPNRVAWKRIAPGQLLYEVEVDGRIVPLRGESVLHLRSLTPDGRRGYSFLSLARDEIGLGLAARTYGSKFFAQDGRPGGVLRHPANLSDDTIQRLRASWEAAHSGLNNAHRVAILEEGMEWQTLGLPPEDMQFLQTRQASRAEIASWFSIPPHMVGDTQKSTSWGSGIESQSQGFLTYTLLPWLVSWAQEVNRSLLSASERSSLYAEHLTAALLRGDLQTRYTAYAQGRQWGWLSVNDIRSLENLDAIDNGDVYLSPLNMGNSDLMVDWPRNSSSESVDAAQPGPPVAPGTDPYQGA